MIRQTCASGNTDASCLSVSDWSEEGSFEKWDAIVLIWASLGIYEVQGPVLEAGI